MTRLRAAAADLAALCTGAPALLLAGEAVPPGLPGIACWRATLRDGHLVLHRPEAAAAPDGAAVPLPARPAGIIGILAPDPASAAPLLAAWDDAPPPVVADAAGLAGLLGAALADRLAETARLQAALAMLRDEAEETREAMAALLRVAGQEAGIAPVLAVATAAAADARATTEGVALVLAQRLGCSLEGVAAVAVHVAEAGPHAALRLRLRGAESGRVRAAWSVPGSALAPGWLTLDLPSPLGPVRETAVLELVAEGALSLSLEDALAPPARRAVLEAGAAAPDRALAVQVQAAPFGRRFVLSPWWDWAARDLPPGLPMQLPEAAWAGARLLAGQGAAVALGPAAPARPVLTLQAGADPALVCLPALPCPGFDLAEVELAVRLGAAEALEVALWALAAPWDGTAPPPPGTRGTGWRQADPVRGGLGLALRLDPGPRAPTMLTLLLGLRHAGAAAEGPAPLQVEWTGATLRRLVPPLPPAPPGAAPSPAFAAAVPEDAVPVLEGAEPVRLVELFAMPGGGYRHLDIQVEGLRLGALRWPRLRFKFAVNGAAPQIEVRARPDWPVLFERWPGSAADEHGPFFILDAAAGGGRAAGLLRTTRDRRLLAALAGLLPTLVATAARAATTDPAEYADWVAMARRLAADLADAEGPEP